VRHCPILFLLIAMPCWSQTDKTGKAETSGFCSPAVAGSHNHFTITCQGVSKQEIAALLKQNQGNVKATLAKLDQCVHGVVNISAKYEALREQVNNLGDTVNRTNLLVRYPLGYVIFEADYKEQVFPYQSAGLEDYKIDWSVVRLIRNTPDHIRLYLPNLTTKDGKSIAAKDGLIDGTLQVGMAGGYSDGNISVWGEILAIKDSGIVFLIGFAPPPPLPPHAKPN